MGKLEDAIAAFERGDAAQCTLILLPLMGQSGDSRPALLLGEACRATGNMALLDRAADWLLAVDPTSIRALIWKGDVLWAGQTPRLAGRYYHAALERADGKTLPPALVSELDRVSGQLGALEANLVTHVDDWLTRNGLPPECRSDRVVQSIHILAGLAVPDRTFQRPTLHHFPGLPHRAWYAADAFEFARDLEAQTPAMRAELEAVLADETAFSPYIQADGAGPARDYQGLADNPDWGAFYFWKDGAPVPENLDRCPVIAKALSAVPQPQLQGRMPTAMFSRLKPHTHIPAHHGMLNCRLIAHLPLIVPDGCAMRVGDEVRPWTEGKLCIFDDSVEHEAWNRSDQTRVVLLFDVARPEITDEEYHAIRQCFEAVDAYR